MIETSCPEATARNLRMLGAGPVGATGAAERETPCSHQPASSPRAARLSGSGSSSAGGVPVMIAASSSAR